MHTPFTIARPQVPYHKQRTRVTEDYCRSAVTATTTLCDVTPILVRSAAAPNETYLLLDAKTPEPTVGATEAAATSEGRYNCVTVYWPPDITRYQYLVFANKYPRELPKQF